MTFRLGSFLQLLAFAIVCSAMGMAAMYSAFDEALAQQPVLVYAEHCIPSI